MEIDFLGLNSRKYHMEQQGCQNVFIDPANEGVETSLSLSSSSSLDSHKQILNFSERKKTWEYPGPSSSGTTLCSLYENSPKIEQPALLLVATQPFHPSAAAAGYLYAASTNLKRNMPPDPTTLYSPKAENTMYTAGDPSTRLPGGYTPTVAMARRATLARFLEKRLHRMNQGRTSPLTGKSLNSEACEAATIARSNKKKNNNPDRR